ncbi:MAG: UDP-N-acetylmuramate--L-alanine ligase [Alistipes sp.]|nr:UDP-N-acetylmuramate--L-alanine ligase [Candidatus Alistipes equi]
MKKDHIYFLGVGGIGMSALARFFNHEKWCVAGYDRTPSRLTRELESEGIAIHYEDNLELIPEGFLNSSRCVVVYTPAIPHDLSEKCYFEKNGFEILKRSEMLGLLSQGKYVIAVAGTHGKTTTSTLVAHLTQEVHKQGNAFLGGISKNFQSNLRIAEDDLMTLEADEFDRSFLRLNPNVAVITSADADHLDIYGTHEKMKEAFSDFVNLIKSDGCLVIRKGVDIKLSNSGITIYRYAVNDVADFYSNNIRLQKDGCPLFDITTPFGKICDCRLGIPGMVNIENATAAVAAFLCASKKRNRDVDIEKLRLALRSFSGVVRRFDVHVNSPKAMYIDDYAHHPREIAATLCSTREIFPNRKITALFQPHLYTRTRDLHEGFSKALSLADEVVLLPIYPAREEPIDGVSSEIIACDISVPCTITDREHLSKIVSNMDTDIVISFGAGNIDACVTELTNAIQKKA